jgi:hypothetical protein
MAVRRGTADRPDVRAVRAALQVAYDRGGREGEGVTS